MTETSPLLLRAAEALRQARRLRPGPDRNELRQIAMLLRELARLDASPAASPAPDAFASTVEASTAGSHARGNEVSASEAE